MRDPAVPAPAPAWPFTVALEDVRARYPRQRGPRWTVSACTRAGRAVALVGPSGAGKTTVANLLLRFLDPEDGTGDARGRDLREYRLEDVRRAISVAGQDSHLFSASIRDNVRLARPDASDAEIEHALRRARIWDWIQRAPGRPGHVRRRGGPRALRRPAAAARRSRERCWPTRRCWCSTSRPPISTRAPRPSSCATCSRRRRADRAPDHAPTEGLDLVDRVLTLGPDTGVA